MAIQTWISGRIGNWFTPANWTTGQVPVPGDSAVINAGTATVSQPTPGPVAGVAGVSILLGGLDTGQPVTLEAVDAVFQAFSGASVINTVLTVTGGEPATSPLNATFLAKGNTSFDGQILVSAKGGGLTIDSEADGIGNAGNFTFNNADQKAVMVVGQESVLTFAGRTITNDGLIEVLGGTDIAAGVTFAGSGIVVLESGGHMTIKGDVVGTGTVATSQKIDFADGTGSVTLANAAGFRGVFGLVSTVSGDRIDLTQIQAQSLRYFRPTAAGLPGHLKLYAGRDGEGAELATLDMELIAAGDLGSVAFDQQNLSTADFTLGSDGHGGTLVTYTPQNGIQLEQSLAAPIVAAAGTTVSFASILQNAFGTSSPGFTSITLLPIQPFANTSVDTGYWGAPNITPTWLVNGVPISGRTRVTDISQVSLVVGNQIVNPASFEAVVTAATSGPQSETITYSAWSVEPAVIDRLRHEGFGAVPTPDAVVASAHVFADLYGEIPNTNLCNWIGDNVAAGAGAPMPLPDALLDPTSNVAGGFWRIAYRGSNSSLITNWSGLVLPGDIVRMGWFKPETGAEFGAHHDRARGGRHQRPDQGVRQRRFRHQSDRPPGSHRRPRRCLLAGHRSGRHHDLPPRSQPAVPDRGHPAGGSDPGLGLQRPDSLRRRRRHHHRRSGRQRDPGHDSPSQHRHRHRSQLGRHARLHRPRSGARDAVVHGRLPDGGRRHAVRAAAAARSHQPGVLVSLRRQRRHIGLSGRRERRRAHGLLRRPALRFPGRRRLRGRAVERCRQSLAGADPDRVRPPAPAA